jgi:hypothetical protein
MQNQSTMESSIITETSIQFYIPAPKPKPAEKLEEKPAEKPEEKVINNLDSPINLAEFIMPPGPGFLALAAEFPPPPASLDPLKPVKKFLLNKKANIPEPEPEPEAPELEEILGFTEPFGILQLTVASLPMTKRPQLLYIKNDMSGSMNDYCSDGRTKMQHSNHTTSNILRLASEFEEAEIWVQIDAFDDKIVRIIPAQRVTKENLSELVAQVNKTMPRNSTNIQLALNDSKEQINKFIEEHHDFDVTQIFTTDGCATTGSQNNQVLAACVDDSYSNIFIGFGLDHSATTMNALSSRKHSAYYFIDKIENGGLVFGEVVHGILYKVAKNITLQAADAEIYDFRTNTWASTLQIDSLTSEAKKTYHLRLKSENPYAVEVKIIGALLGEEQSELETAFCIPPLVDLEGNLETPEQDLSKYIFRQRTQEFLFEAQQASQKSSYELKKSMKHFLASMKAYMKKHELTEDSTFQSLNDDLVVVIRTLGTRYQTMYSAARGNSNGREYSYNVSETPRYEEEYDYNITGNILRRHNAINGDLNQFNDDDLAMCCPVPLSRGHTTQQQISLMRYCSDGTPSVQVLDDYDSATPMPAAPVDPEEKEE